jgi:protein-tyrosine-phosphatase
MKSVSATKNRQGVVGMTEKSSSRKHVLFVCVENSNRSQMAEAFARIHGGKSVEAFSAGSRPSGRINPKAIDAMREVGYELTTHGSKSLQDIPTGEYDAAVTMGCGDACPMVRAKRREEWQIPDPREMPPEEFRAVRNLIEQKVKALLASL